MYKRRRACRYVITVSRWSLRHDKSVEFLVMAARVGGQQIYRRQLVIQVYVEIYT